MTTTNLYISTSIKRHAITFSTLLLGSVAMMSTPALAQSNSDTKAAIEALQRQIRDIQAHDQAQMQALQDQVSRLVVEQKNQAAQTAQAQAAATQAQAAVAKASSGSGGLGTGTFSAGGVHFKVGGFIEAAGIYRSSNETADVGSNYGSGIPFSGSPMDHLSEFRFSARQSRIAFDASGDPDKDTSLRAYYEMDFLGQAGTANSNESNSFNPRARHLFAEYDRKDWGFSFLGGQTWSLATLNTAGMNPLSVNSPNVIDAQYNVGFNWTRAPQLRVTQKIGDWAWAGLSLENPQALTYIGPNTPSGLIINNPGVGGGLLNGAGSFTLDVAPDTIVKVAAEPGWGHYELYGMLREFRSDFNGRHQVSFGEGIGAGAIVPIIPKLLDFSLTALYGEGVGKYASGGLPDVTFNPGNGKPAPIREFTALAGLAAHPTPALDLFGYFGVEQSSKEAFTMGGKTYGYGNTGYTNKACAFGNVTTTSGSTGLGCNIDRLWQVQAQAWYKFYQGNYGMMELGASFSHVQVSTFQGTTGDPHTGENIVMTSFRYYPFQ